MGAVIKMQAAVAGGSESALATIDIPMPGSIVGAQWACNYDLDADLESVVAQLSFRSTIAAANDDRGVISEVRGQLNLTTSGGAFGAINLYTIIPELSVMGGERIYIHSSCSAGVTGTVVCLVHFDFDLDKVSMRRR
jgi:hypothetical protein